MPVLGDKAMEIIRGIIKSQDARLRELAGQHQDENPGHVVGVYNNFIQCEQCDYHVHVSGLSVVQHTAKKVVSVEQLKVE